MAPMIDGSLEILERGIRLFSGPNFTKDILESLGIAVEDLRTGTKPVGEVIREVANKSPALATEFREWVSCGSAFVGAMAAVAAAVFAWSALPGQNRAVEDVAIDAFESVYEQPQPVFREVPPLMQRPDMNHQRDGQAPNRKTRRAQAAKQRLTQR